MIAPPIGWEAHHYWRDLELELATRQVGISAACVCLALLMLGRALLPVADRGRVRLAIFFVFAYLLLLFVKAGLLHAGMESAYGTAQLGALVALAWGITATSGFILFDLAGRRLHIPKILRDLSVTIASAVAMILILSRSGVNLLSIITTSAVLTAVIGLALQDTLGNLLSGVAMQLESSIAIGDWIRLDERAIGKVLEIRWRSTVIRTKNDDLVVIPNAILTKGVVTVFNSHHFGAAGCYAKIAADRGVIGMVTSATRWVTLVPTFAAEPVMGTNPLAFAAPARRNAPFQLDMATTTVAAGKVKVYKLNHKPVPSGWVVDGDGRPVTDETAAFGHVFERPEGGITPLGGTRELGGHKGYGLAVMVHILGGTLAGASFSPLRNRTQRDSDPHNIGHFFMAIDPGAFRDEGEFEADLDDVIDVLHGAKRADPRQPVLVAGDPERLTRAERLEQGVPVPDDLMEQLREVTARAGVPLVL